MCFCEMVAAAMCFAFGLGRYYLLVHHLLHAVVVTIESILLLYCVHLQPFPWLVCYTVQDTCGTTIRRKSNEQLDRKQKYF